MKDLTSICITSKNRSKVILENKILYLLPDCISSLKNTIEDNNIELIIADWGSTDWPIQDWIEYKAPDIPIQIINIKSDKFSVGKGRNIAASNANGDYLFFIDADVVLNREAFNEAILLAKTYKVGFPKIIYQQQYNQDVYTLDSGAGNVLITTELFNEIGKWPEYWSYGFEDIEFANKLKAKLGELKTTETPFVHKWHPNKYGWAGKQDIQMNAIVDQCKKEVDITEDINILKNIVSVNLKHNPLTTHKRQ
jgi:glycosyltransferase involved in cell wall biosynthesis